MDALLMFLMLLSAAAVTQSATKIHTIHWNASNPMFRPDADSVDSNVITINGASNHAFEYDQVNIVCPVYKAEAVGSQLEQYIIYSVTKQEYDSCRITQPNPKIVALCNRPFELMYFTITFRSFTPTPGGLEFRPGQDYYFISTSSREDLHRRVGGACSTHNMRVMFKVGPESSESNVIDDFGAKSAAAPVESSSQRFPWSQSRDFRRTFSPLATYPAAEMEEVLQRRPKDFSDGAENNDVVQQEAYASGAAAAFNSFGLVLAAALVLTRTRNC